MLGVHEKVIWFKQTYNLFKCDWPEMLEKLSIFNTLAPVANKKVIRP